MLRPKQKRPWNAKAVEFMDKTVFYRVAEALETGPYRAPLQPDDFRATSFSHS
jgi:hypothetical protein